ncbi:MAG: alpha/beta fold hydrolase [Planctomycetales bacterium]|nr:alpha/beta fold hydrolase [Planctomycetales bacterium]
MSTDIQHADSPSRVEGWRSLYPFQSHRIEIGGHQIHYLDEGTGPVLLMVHGNPTWSFYWRNLVVAWRPHYRVIVVDHLGCGLSDKPQNYDYCLATHTANLVALVDRLGLQQATLLAHDWGGAIGLGAVVQRPDQFARIVLFNTGAFPPPRVPLRIAACRFPVLGRWGLQGLNLFSRAAMKMATERPGGLPPLVEAGLLAPFDSWRHRLSVTRFVQDIPLTRRHRTYAVLDQLEQDLRALPERPVQLVWGMRDWCFTPQCLEQFIEIFPQAAVHRIADAGHWVIEDSPDEIVEVVGAFLEKTASS